MTATARADRAAARAAEHNYRWWVLLVTSTGALLASLTSGTLVIALPDILRELHTDLFALMWIVVGYTLVTTVLVLNAGRLADSIGRARAYTIGFAIFLVASILCALAPTAETLVGARVLQGVGGAFVMATSAALVTDAFPRGELGRALGINAMVVGAGLILGPILGGWLTGFGWRTVFWFNVPIALIGTIAAATILVDPPKLRARITFDWVGSGLYLAGLLGLMTALAFGGIYGWTTTWVIGGIVVFLVAAPAFLWVESHRADPLLDLSLFKIRLFAMGNLTSLLNGVARNGVLFLLVFYLQGAKGDDPVTAGIKLAPLALGLLVLSPISGVLADRYGSRGLATLGMIVTGIGLLGLTTLQVDTPYWQLAIWQLIIGAGSGLFASPNTSAVMGVVPPAQRGVGAGARMMLTNSGFVISIALSIGLVTSAMDPKVLLSIFSGTQVGSSGIDLEPFMDALHLAFWAGVVASALGAIVSWNRGEHTTWEDDPGRLDGGHALSRRGRLDGAGGMTIRHPARPGRPSLGSLPALSHRNYRLFFGGQLISLIGTWMTTVAQSWLVLQLTGNPFDLGLIAVFQFGPVLVLGLFGGLIADSLPKRPTMYVTQIVAMIVSFLLFFLAATGTVQVWQVFALAAVMGIRNSVDMPTRQAFAVEMVGKGDIGNAVALNSAMFNGARVLGPAIAGLTIGAFGVSIAFLIDGFSFLAVLLALFLMQADELHPSPRIDRPTTVREVGHNLADGLRYVRRTGIVLLAVTLIGLVSTFGINFNVLIPPLAQDVLHVGASGYGFLMAASGLGSLVAALFIAFGGTKAIRMLYGALVLGLAQVVMGFTGSFPADLLLMFVAGAGSITMMATANTTIQLVVPDVLRGRVMSVYLTVFAGTSPIGGLLFGALAANAGAQAAIAIGGAISAVVAVLGFVWLSRLQRAASAAQAVAVPTPVAMPTPGVAPGTAAASPSVAISAAQATSAEGFVARRP